MKNYDLSQYVLRDGNTMIFPLTKEEVCCLISGQESFAAYIRLPYYAKQQSIFELKQISDCVDMEDDHWFLSSQWVAVDIMAKAIVGYLRLEKVDQLNKIVLQVTEEKCESITKNDVLELFYKFLSLNNFYNIIVEDIDKKVVKNEN